MDDADRASELEQKQRDAALAGVRARRATLPPTGACYNCSAPLAGACSAMASAATTTKRAGARWNGRDRCSAN